MLFDFSSRWEEPDREDPKGANRIHRVRAEPKKLIFILTLKFPTRWADKKKMRDNL